MRLATHGALVAALVVLAGRAPAQGNSITWTGPSTLTISSATPGSQPNGTNNQSANYSVNVTSGRMKVTGSISGSIPAGVTLTIALAAPAGAITLGPVVLTGSPQDLVRYIPVGQYTGLTITFSLAATTGAGVVPYRTNSIVLTLVEDP